MRLAACSTLTLMTLAWAFVLPPTTVVRGNAHQLALYWQPCECLGLLSSAVTYQLSVTSVWSVIAVTVCRAISL